MARGTSSPTETDSSIVRGESFNEWMVELNLKSGCSVGDFSSAEEEECVELKLLYLFWKLCVTLKSSIRPLSTDTRIQ